LLTSGSEAHRHESNAVERRCPSSRRTDGALPTESLDQIGEADHVNVCGVVRQLRMDRVRRSHQRVNILGVGVSAITMAEALETIEQWITHMERRYICVRDVHGVMKSQRDDALRRIHNAAGLVTPDGMPLVWLSWLKGFRHVERVYGPDLMLACCQFSITRGYRHFFYGGGEGVAERLASRLKERFPGLAITGTFSPPFRPLEPDEDEEAVRYINQARPDIVWVGLGTPKQELWMRAHVGRLTAPVLVGVGAAFDFHAGVKPQAPRWIQRAGLEWLFRMLAEPRRLGPRYLLNNPWFVWEVFLQSIGVKKYDLPGGQPECS